MFLYAIKRVARSYKLFIALTIGVLVATSFFASTNVAADLLARDALDSSIDGVVYDFVINSPNWPLRTGQGSNWTGVTFSEIENEISSISQITECTRTSWAILDYNNSGTEFDVLGLDFESDMASGLSLITGRDTLGPNETYILSGSWNESLFQIDDIIEVPMKVYRTNSSFEIVHWNLTVAGVVSLPETRTLALLQNPNAGIFIGSFGIRFESTYNVLLTDWNGTSRQMLESLNDVEDVAFSSMLNSIHLKVNREILIDPYNIQSSIDRLNDLYRVISERVQPYGAVVTSSLIMPLQVYMILSLIMNLQFVGLSLPIFFMAYFTGTMVSDVSFNLRRREIGLLLTKGYRRSTIRNMFLVEGLIVGAIAGAASIFIGSTVAYLTVQTSLDYLTVLGSNVTSIALSVVLGMFLALISVWRPANRASKLETLDALKQYVYVEETSEYKRLLPMITFFLGTYKLVVWILGISVTNLISSINFGNLFLAMFAVAWIMVDNILNYFGPLFFLYGATKIFMRGSLKFQEGIVNAGQRFFGAFGRLATRNVKRNPARNAALVFILALIVSYGIFTIGNLYSQFDQVERDAKYTVGSDLRLELNHSANITDLETSLVGHEQIASVTEEHRVNLLSADVQIETRGIKPQEWLETAFWESDWFIGDIQEMINNLDESHIILSLDVAQTLSLDVGDSISLRAPLSQETYQLQIVGLIGYQSVLAGFVQDFGFSVGGSYPSFVNSAFLNETGIIDFSTANLLIKTTTGTNGTTLQEEFGSTLDGLEQTYSVTSELADYYSRPIQRGPVLIQGVAIMFAVILGMVGSALVIVLTLREKDGEIALFTVRGFSKWQLFKTLFAEMLLMVFFALILGSIVGVIQIFGNVSLVNSNATGLIRSRVVVGGMAGVWMLAILAVVVVAAAIPVYMASRRPETKVDVLRK